MRNQNDDELKQAAHRAAVFLCVKCANKRHARQFAYAR